MNGSVLWHGSLPKSLASAQPVRFSAVSPRLDRGVNLLKVSWFRRPRNDLEIVWKCAIRRITAPARLKGLGAKIRYSCSRRSIFAQSSLNLIDRSDLHL